MFLETAKQSKLKKFFERIFHEETIVLQDKSIKKKKIKCHDCKRRDYAVFYKTVGDYDLPYGWLQVCVGLRSLFLCEECQAKRAQYGNELIGGDKI
jgi:hypothetical protein